jgi:hypothetical protein
MWPVFWQNMKSLFHNKCHWIVVAATGLIFLLSSSLFRKKVDYITEVKPIFNWIDEGAAWGDHWTYPPVQRIDASKSSTTWFGKNDPVYLEAARHPALQLENEMASVPEKIKHGYATILGRAITEQKSGIVVNAMMNLDAFVTKS